MISNSPHIHGSEDLVRLEQEEHKLNRKKHGAFGNAHLSDKVKALKADETLDVIVVLKEPDGINYLDKTKHAEEEPLPGLGSRIMPIDKVC